MRVSVFNYFFFLNNQFWYKIPLTLRLGKKREKNNNHATLFFSFHQIIFMIIDINHNINEITVFQA